jgi:putative transposase
LDLYSRKTIGWEVWKRGQAEHASHLIKRVCREEKIMTKKEPLVLHSDNGSSMKRATILKTLYALGVIPSRSRPRVSNDNPYAEIIITLKYRPNYQPTGFINISEAYLWVMGFVKWYNNKYMHSGINFVSTIQRHK